MIDNYKIDDLLQRVPHPPEEPPPPGIDDSECERFAIRTGITMPSDLQEWLKITNGPCVGPGGFYGIRPTCPFLDIESRMQIFPNWYTTKWLPIAGDGCGNYFVMPTLREYGDSHPIVFVDTTNSSSSPLYVVSSDLDHFIIATLEEELGATDWPFSRNFVINFDPDILKCSGVALPWEV